MSAAKRTSRSGDRAVRRRPSAQRVRAARAWIGLERPAFAERTGISIDRLNYLENGKGDPRPEELDAIERVTGVPMWFLQQGFDLGDAPADTQVAKATARGSIGGRTATYRSGVPADGMDVDVVPLMKVILELSERVADLEGSSTERPSAQVAQLLEQVVQAQQRRREGSQIDPDEQDRLRRVQEGDAG